ncbi:MAG: hypothetical protein HY403_01790 [Elusimicrobia bacterium]|nr:hypothetical protein [Elusimicrobiota bacterium]
MRTMRRWCAALTTLLALALVLPAAVAAQSNPRYWLQVVGDDDSVITSGYCRPLTAGTNTEPTVYTTATLATAKSVPISINTTTGECEWYQTRGQTYDVMVYVTAGTYRGTQMRVKNFTGVGKAVAPAGGAMKVMVVPFSATASLTTTQASESVPAGALIKDILIETKTPVSASRINVGLLRPGQEYDNLCARISTATVGFANCSVTTYLTPENLTITHNNENHASAGYLYVYYLRGGNDHPSAAYGRIWLAMRR